MKRAVIIPSLALWIIVASHGSAAAEPPALLRAGTRALFASLALGPAVQLEDTPTQFKLAQTFGYHFSGRSDGEAIAIDVQESFGKSFVAINIVPRFVWDIQVIDDLGLYLTPSAGLGVSFWVPEQGDVIPGLTFQFAFAVKLLLADRWLVFFRPVGLDVHPMTSNDQWSTGVRYELMLGGGATF
jgi:hypothetical protein